MIDFGRFVKESEVKNTSEVLRVGVFIVGVTENEAEKAIAGIGLNGDNANAFRLTAFTEEAGNIIGGIRHSDIDIVVLCTRDRLSRAAKAGINFVSQVTKRWEVPFLIIDKEKGLIPVNPKS